MDQYTCPFCTQQISTHAKKCSYCHEWLKPGKWNSRNPQYQLLSIVVVALITFFILQFAGNKIANIIPKPSDQKFVKGTSKIFVISKKLVKNGQRLFIAGEVRNEEKVYWQSVIVTAEYFNKSGEKIDRSSDYINVKAGEVQSYQIEFFQYDKSDHSLYDNYKVEVTSASNYGN